MSIAMEARKRRRIFKNPLPTTHHVFLKFLLLCFCIFLLFMLFSRGLHSVSGPFQPAPIVPKLAIFASSMSNSVQDLTTPHKSDGASSGTNSGKGSPMELKVENRVLFTDHVLVILPADEKGSSVNLAEKIDCVYHRQLDGYSVEETAVTFPMLSADEYERKWIVRCPAPPANYSAAVGLRGHRNEVAGSEWVAGMTEKNQTIQSWDYVAYEAVLDGEETAAVFVKGLHLRSDRESDPRYFSCHFRIRNVSEKGSKDVELTTKAITAAQEVIRCPVPPPLKTNLRNNEDVQITVTRDSHHEILPSVAKLSQNENNKKGSYKYELCACTMVWNQAVFIREWITYHSWIGVQKWFIYDNNSDDGLKEVVDELDSENYNVSRHVWPWVKSQEAGFSHCVLRARDQCKWVGFFDVDEFYYFPPKSSNRFIDDIGPDSLRAIVKNMSSSTPNIGEIRTDCHSFGPSGLKKSPAEGVMLGYTCRLRSPERHKSIVRPDAVDDTLLNQVHHFKLKKEFRKTTLPQSTALINHYKYQVWDTFKAKFYRRVSTYVVDWQENQNEKSRDRAPGLGTEAIEPADWHKRFCEVWDTRLRDFVLAILGDPDTGLVPWGKSNQ